IALAADEHWRARLLDGRRVEHGAVAAVVATVERERLTARRQQTAAHLDRLRETREPVTRAREVDADRVVVGLVPARAETDVDATAADPVERRERLREDRRRAQHLAHHERPEPRPVHRTCERAERGDRLVRAVATRVGPVLREVEEHVVGQPQRVEAELLGATSERDDRVPPERVLAGDGVVVLRERESDAHTCIVRKVGRWPNGTYSSAWSTCRRAGGATSSTRSPERAAHACSTSMSTPTTTAASSHSAVQPSRSRTRHDVSPRTRHRCSTCACTTACTRASASSTSSRSSRWTRRRENARSKRRGRTRRGPHTSSACP